MIGEPLYPITMGLMRELYIRGVRSITLTDAAADRLCSELRGHYNPNIPDLLPEPNQISHGAFMGITWFREGKR